MLFMVVADDTNSVAMKSHITVQFNHRIHCNLIKILVKKFHEPYVYKIPRKLKFKVTIIWKYIYVLIWICSYFFEHLKKIYVLWRRFVMVYCRSYLFHSQRLHIRLKFGTKGIDVKEKLKMQKNLPFANGNHIIYVNQ